MKKLSAEERETLIVVNRSDNFVSISTSDPTDIRHMSKLGLIPYLSQGSYHQYRVPKSWFRRISKGLTISLPKAVSQKQRENASRLGKIYGSRNIRLTA